jgi:hypothetical protein
MQELLTNVKVGKRYVCLDGAIILADAERIEFSGWHSRHTLPYVPQVAALKDNRVVRNVLSNAEYWQASALAVWRSA